MKRILFLCVAAGFLAGCQDASLPTGENPGSPLLLVIDGRDVDANGDLLLTGDFFWLPPLERNPVNEPTYEAGNADLGLLSDVVLRICLPTGMDPVTGRPTFSSDPCASGDAFFVTEFTSSTTPAIQIIDEHYQVDWDTHLFDLTAILGVRIFALLLGSELKVGLADVEIFESGKEFKTASGDVIVLKDGRTLPLNTRFQAGIRCFRQGLTPLECGAGTVDPDVGGTVSYSAPDGSVSGGTTTAGVFVAPLAPHDGSHTDDVVFVVQSCVVATGFVNLVTDLPFYGPCVDVTAFIGNVQISELPDGQLITVFACLTDVDLTGFRPTLKPGQEDLILMHRQANIGVVEALPAAENPCALILDLASSPSNGIVRFARAVLDGVAGFIGPKTLQARRRRIDILSGGVTGPFSQFQLLLPGIENKVIGTDNLTGLVGTDVTLQVRVLDGGVTSQTVENANVHFEISAGAGSLNFSEVSTDPSGIAEVVLTLGLGETIVRAFGFGIADQLDAFPFFDPADLIAISLNTGEEFFTATGVSPDPGDTWTLTGSMSAARRDQTGTLLSNGKVLVVGGTGALLYDPATETFSSAGTTEFSHGSLATATNLSDGTVLIVGGTGALTSAEIYDPVAQTFTVTTGAPSADRIAHSATLLSDGRVLLAGGQNAGSPETHAFAELYDPITKLFATTANLNDRRSGHSATLLGDGRVLIVGGTQTTAPGIGFCLASAELFDPTGSGTFSSTGSLVQGGRCGLFTGSPLLADGTVLVAGGNFATPELFNPAGAGTFSTTGSMATRHSAGTATLLSDGRVLVAGGNVATGPITTNSAELFNPLTGLFTAAASMNVSRQQHVATRLSDGRVLAVGGFSQPGGTGGANVSSAEFYSPGVAVISAVNLSSTTVTIGGSVPYTATVINSTGITLSTVVVQAIIVQGSTERAAGGRQVDCGAGLGELPPGTCTVTLLNLVASPLLSAGSALARFELRQGSTTFDTFTIPVITLVN